MGAAGQPTNGESNMQDRKKTATKAPTHIAYQVSDRGENQSFWTRIGAAWANADGKGFNIQLDAVPLSGRITLRVPSEREE
jgi:hypothetical protein